MKLSPPDPGDLRLASYNIQKCVGLDLRRAPRRILTVLEGLGARIVVLQEADYLQQIIKNEIESRKEEEKKSRIEAMFRMADNNQKKAEKK